MVTRGHRMAAQIFEHAADEVTHIDQRDLRQAVEFLHAGFGARAGGAGDVSETGGAGDFDAGMDRMNPRRARIGHDDAGGAEDRQAADDAETAVERFGRQRFAAGNRNLDIGVGGAAGCDGDFGDGVSDDAARHRIDGGLAGRHWQAGARDGADAFAGAKCHARSDGADTNGGADERAVGHVGIVAGVLDHAGRRRALVLARHREREARPLAARQCHLDRVGKLAGNERGESRLCRRRGASPGGPTPAQWRDVLGHNAPFAPSFSPVRRGRHDGLAS